MITVLGSINLDLVATVNRLPTPGETVAGGTFETSPGGKGANQALAATLSGSDVRMVGATGDDGFSETALKLLRQAGTDLSLVRTEDAATGTAVILVDASGENMITVIPGANDRVDSHLTEAALGGMSPDDFLMLQLEIPAATVERALLVARGKGITTILNTAPFTVDAVRLAALADIVIANETEFDLLTGSPATTIEARMEALHGLHAKTGQTYVVTLGKDGVIAIRNGELQQADSFKIQPVDTVGAGDTFCGYLASSLDQGMAFEEALARAATAASLTCLSKGAQSAIPRSDDVRRISNSIAKLQQAGLRSGS
jgi:ribokinase